MTVEHATQLLGIPFERSGRSSAGVDCLGIVVLYYEARGVPFVDPWSAEHAAAWRAGRPEDRPTPEPSSASGEWREVRDRGLPDMRDGDLVVSGDGRHVEVYVGAGLVLRALFGSTSHLSRLRLRNSDKVWRWHP